MEKEILIWIKKLIVTILIGLLCYGIYISREIFFILLISGFLTIIISPLVTLGEKYKIPAWVTVIGVFIAIILLLLIVVGTLIPIISNYISDSIGTVTSWTNNAKEIYLTQGIEGFHLNPYIERAILFLFGEKNIDHTFDIIKQNAGNIQSFLTSQISSITSGGISIMSQVGGAITNWLLIAISTFLMILERKSIGKYIIDSVSLEKKNFLNTHFAKTQQVFTAWMRAMLILSISIFIVTYFGLSLVDFLFDISLGKTFTLALISGIMEFIPYVGPLIALIPAVILALGISWKAALIITILYLLIQRVENDFLVPYVMSRALDLSPFFVFIVMLLGATLGGVLGIILAIPIAGVISITFDEYRKRNTHPVGVRSGRKDLTNTKKSISSKSTQK
ncbi:MAG: AI-2E family transporter [Candidatus Altimarinota bacterium]